MPRYTVYAAQGDQARASQLVLLNLGVAAVLVIPAALGMLVLGQWFIALWTGGLVAPSLALLAVMIAGMLVDAAWFPLSNLLLAINRHGSWTYLYLIASVVSIAVGVPMVSSMGALGMAWALLAQELVMLVWVWRVASGFDLVSMGQLRGAARALIAELHVRRNSVKEPRI